MGFQGRSRISTQLGMPPTGYCARSVRPPCSGLIACTLSWFESSPAASRKRPRGSMAKPRERGIGVRRRQQEAAAAVGDDICHGAKQRRDGEVRQPAAGRIDGKAGRREGWAAQCSVEEPAVRANGHRQAGRGRQASAGHRHALDQAQRAAFGVHFESEDFLGLGVRDVRNRLRHALLRDAADARANSWRQVHGRL